MTQIMSAGKELPLDMLISFIAAVGFGLTALYVAIARRHKPTWTAGVILLCACAELTAAHALQLSSSDQETRIFWYKMVYMGFTVTPTAFLYLALRFSGLGHVLTNRTRLLLSIFPVLTGVLILTNEIHGLVWNPAITTSYAASREFLAGGDAGIWYWAFITYSYSAMGVGCFLLIRLLIRSRRIYRWQTSIVIVAAVLAILGSMLDIFRVSPLPPFSTTALGLAIGSITVTYILSPLRRRDLLVVTRATVFNSISDAIIVIDGDKRIMDMNPAAEKLVGRPASRALSKPLEQLLPTLTSLLTHDASTNSEVALYLGITQSIYDLRLSVIQDMQGDTMGQVIVLRDITERKQAEEALAKSEARYRSLVETTSAGVATIDLAGNLVFVNQALCNMAGCSEEELLGKPFASFLHPDDMERVTQLFLNTLQDPDSRVELEFRAIQKDGNTIYCYSTPIILWHQGEIAGFNAIIQDITERKRAEQALQEGERRFREMLENVEMIAIMLDIEGRVTFCNDYLLRLSGYSRADVLGKNWFALFVPPELHIEDILMAALHQGTIPAHFENEILNASGEHLLVSWNNTILRDVEGHAIGTTSIGEEITERKRGEEALSKSEAELKEAQRVGQIGSWDWDTTTDTFTWSEEFNRIYGVDPRQRPFGYEEHLKAYTPESAERLVNAVMHSVQNGEGYELELELACPDGTRRGITARGEVKRDAKGQIVGLRGTAQDITERKLAEDALRESRKRLARLSRQLVEAQEQERRRIARELHDEVGQSLTALTISLDGVSKLASKGVVRGKIAEIQGLTKHLIAEVNALSVELRPRVLDDLGLIPGLLSLFSRFSTQTGIEIDFKHSVIERKRVTPEIEISAYRIVQEALTNVVRHAGVKTASVRLQVEGDILYIQVQDEGKGFDLQRAMNAEDSMGLLSMMERAEQVGGHLAVEAASGEGTIITCRLPLAGNPIEE